VALSLGVRPTLASVPTQMISQQVYSIFVDWFSGAKSKFKSEVVPGTRRGEHILTVSFPSIKEGVLKGYLGSRGYDGKFMTK
jgi:hypothetical protein